MSDTHYHNQIITVGPYEEIDSLANQSLSSNSSSSSLEIKNSANSEQLLQANHHQMSQTSQISQMSEEAKQKAREKRSKRNSFRRMFGSSDKEEKNKEPKENKEKNESSGLTRTLSGMFKSDKSDKSDKHERDNHHHNNDENNKNRRRNENNESPTKRKNRRSFIFFSDDERESERKELKVNRRDISSSTSDVENNSKQSKNKQKNRLSLNIEKLLGLDDDSNKYNRSNTMSDLFLPENETPIRSHSRHNSGRNSPNTETFPSIPSTSSPLNNIPTDNNIPPNLPTNLPIIITTEVVDEENYSPDSLISDNYKDDSSTPPTSPENSIDEGNESNIDKLDTRDNNSQEISQDNNTQDNSQDNSLDNSQIMVENTHNEGNEDENSDEAIQEIQNNYSIPSHHQEKYEDSTPSSPLSPITPKYPYSSKTQTQPKFVFANSDSDSDYVNENYEEENSDMVIVERDRFHTVEKVVEKQQPPKIIEKKIIITQESPETLQKLEELKTNNDSLISVKRELESKILEQSQQIDKLSSLETVMKEKHIGMEDTVRQLESKIGDQCKEINGLRIMVEQFQKTPELGFNENQIITMRSLSSHTEEINSNNALIPSRMATMEITTTPKQNSQGSLKNTLVNTLVVRPLVNTITISASIAGSVLYAVYLKPLVIIADAIAIRNGGSKCYRN